MSSTKSRGKSPQPPFPSFDKMLIISYYSHFLGENVRILVMVAVKNTSPGARHPPWRNLPQRRVNDSLPIILPICSCSKSKGGCWRPHKSRELILLAWVNSSTSFTWKTTWTGSVGTLISRRKRRFSIALTALKNAAFSVKETRSTDKRVKSAGDIGQASAKRIHNRVPMERR